MDNKKTLLYYSAPWILVQLLPPSTLSPYLMLIWKCWFPGNCLWPRKQHWVGGAGVEIWLFACLLAKTLGRVICLNCFQVHDCGLKNFKTKIMPDLTSALILTYKISMRTIINRVPIPWHVWFPVCPTFVVLTSQNEIPVKWRKNSATLSVCG